MPLQDMAERKKAERDGWHGNKRMDAELRLGEDGQAAAALNEGAVQHVHDVRHAPDERGADRQNA